MQTVSELIQEKTIEVIGVNIISHFYKMTITLKNNFDHKDQGHSDHTDCHNDSSNYSDCSHSDAWK